MILRQEQQEAKSVRYDLFKSSDRMCKFKESTLDKTEACTEELHHFFILEKVQIHMQV